MSRIDGLIRSNTGPRVEKSPSGGDDIHGRLSSPLAPSFGRVYDQEDDHNQPAKKSVLARVRDKARKWRHTLLKKRHGQDGANVTPAWGVTLEEDDDEDDFQAYDSELGNEYKDNHNRNAFSPPAAATNNDLGSKGTPKTSTRNNSLSSTAEKQKHSIKPAAAQMPDVSAEKQREHESRETQTLIISGNISSSPPPDHQDHQLISEKEEEEDKDESVKNQNQTPAAPHPVPAADEDEESSENPSAILTPGFIAEKLVRKGKSITPLPVALHNEKRGWVDAPVRNPSPMPAKGRDYRDKSMSRRTLHATPVASIKEEPQHTDTPFIHPSTLPSAAMIRKPSPAAAATGAADQREYFKDVKIADDDAEVAAPAEKAAVKNSSSSKTLTEMVADTLQPVYNMVSGATQNVATKFQGGAGAAEGGRDVEGSGRPCSGSRLEKSVSVKEYLMQKLEPGAEERALSRVISDVMAPKNVGAKAEVGVMGKMRGAVTSFLGMEQDSSSSVAQAPATDNQRAAVETQKTVQFSSEETEERRLQAN